MTAPVVAAVASETQNSSTTTRDVPAPPNIAVGNLLVAIIFGHNNFTINTRPSGWGNWILQDESTDETLCVEWKEAVAGDVGATSFQWTTTGSSSGPEIMLRITGQKATTPLDVKSSGTSPNGTSHTTPTIATTVIDTLILSFFGQDETSAGTWSGGGDTEHADLADTGFFQNGSVYSSAKASIGNVSKTATSSLTDPAVVGIIAIKPASGLSATVNQVTETNLAQALTRVKRKALGQVTESDLAQAITRRKILAVSQVLESDLAQSVITRKLKAIGQVNETDLAQAVTRPQIFASVNQVIETDLAQAVTSRKLKAVAQVIETDLAQAVASRKLKAVAQVIETDLAQAVASRKLKAVAQVIETDLAQAVTSRKLKAVAQVVETDLAQAVTRRKLKVIGQVVETDLAQAVTQLLNNVIQQAFENDLAQALTGRKQTSLGQALESDAAQALFRQKVLVVGQVVETDSALLVAVLLGGVLRLISVNARVFDSVQVSSMARDTISVQAVSRTAVQVTAEDVP